MTSLLSSFAESMTPSVIGKLTQAVGLDASKTQKGLEVVGPLLLGSLARKSETTTGLDGIMRMLPEDGGAGFLSSPFGQDQPSGGLASASLLTGLLGPGVSAIGKSLSARLGFNVTPLLAAAAPAILGLIRKMASEQKLNSAGIASLLQTQHSASVSDANPEVKAVLDDAFRLGDKAEKLKATFDDEEWRKIRLSPLAVTSYVVSASPSGLAGLSKEVIAAGDAMRLLVKDALPTTLVDVAFGSVSENLELGAKDGLDVQAPRSSLLTMLSGAAVAVKAKSPADAQAFGDTLVALSRKVAEASKEGGFFGIGGKRVSAEEQRAIGEIRLAVEGRVASV
jgi:Bacterial protein of unknown function (DUF937)